MQKSSVNTEKYSALCRSIGCEFIEELTNRRGVAVLKVARGESLYAIKLSIEDALDKGVYDPRVLIEREGNILKKLGPLADNLYIDHGVSEPTRWLLLHWLEKGEPVARISNFYRVMKDEEQKKKEFLNLFIHILEKYVAFHKAGYTHGDVQPQHIFMVDNMPVIIDWGLGKHKDDKDFVYRGGLAHYVSPEVAEGMLKKSDSIPYDQCSEVYSLAATLFILFTGKTPIFYGTEDYTSVSLEQKLQLILKNKIASFEQTGATPFPELEGVLKECLSAERARRYNADSFLEKLREIRI